MAKWGEGDPRYLESNPYGVTNKAVLQRVFQDVAGMGSVTDWQVAPDVTYRIWNSCGRDGRHTRRRGNMRARIQEVGKVVFAEARHGGGVGELFLSTSSFLPFFLFLLNAK